MERSPSGFPGAGFIHWLASYPKSGSTWLRSMVHLYGIMDGSIQANVDDIGTYWTQAASPVPITDLSIHDVLQVRGAAMAHLACSIKTNTLVKTHNAFLYFEKMPFFARNWANRLIYVVRAPRDIVASLQNHNAWDTREETIAFMGNERAALHQAGRVPYIVRSWSFHVRSWIGDGAPQELEPPLLVRYEDIHEDPHREVMRVLEHLGLEPIPGRVQNAVAECTFEKMKGREEARGFKEKSEAQRRAGLPFFRRGEVGGWRDELTEEQVARVEGDHGEVMEKLGYAKEVAYAAEH